MCVYTICTEKFVLRAYAQISSNSSDVIRNAMNFLLILVLKLQIEVIFALFKIGYQLSFELLIWCFIYLFLDKTPYKK